MTDLYELYRNNSAAGQGTKDWAIKVTDSNEITVQFGKTGSKLRSRVLKLAPNADLKRELFERVSQKMSEGYSKVGMASIDDNGNVTLAQNIENQVWSLSELDKEQVLGTLKSLVEDIVAYSFDTGFSEWPISAEYDENVQGAIFYCDGLLPEEGWQICNKSGLSFMTGSKVIGGDKIDYSIELLLLAGWSSRLPDGALTAVASKGQQERSLLPTKRGLPAEFIEELNLPTSYVREVAMAVGIIAKPIEIISKEAVSTPSAICF